MKPDEDCYKAWYCEGCESVMPYQMPGCNKKPLDGALRAHCPACGFPLKFVSGVMLSERMGATVGSAGVRRRVREIKWVGNDGNERFRTTHVRDLPLLP